MESTESRARAVHSLSCLSLRSRTRAWRGKEKFKTCAFEARLDVLLNIWPLRQASPEEERDKQLWRQAWQKTAALRFRVARRKAPV